MRVHIDTYNIVIHDEAIVVLNQFTQKEAGQPEAGGVILGKIMKNEIHIMKLSPPTELDKASRTNFERHRLSAQIVINHEFYNSYKQITYLGEWHTHPEDFPSPSDVDRKMIQEQFSKNKIHTDFLLLFIKGLKVLYIGILNKRGLIHVNISITTTL